jgi:cation diffusion facilitator family transporter
MNKDIKALGGSEIKWVTNISIVTNILLTIAKFIVGFLGGSLAIISDGVHSLSDMVTDVAVILGVQFGSKAPDIRHPYGHGRIETFAGLFVAIALVFVGSGMIYYAAIDIAAGKVLAPTTIMYVVTIASILAKEWLFQITKGVAIKTHSAAAYANAWHHRSDALSSVAVLVGLIAIKFGFKHGDEIAAMVVGLMVIFVGISVIRGSLSELAESAVDQATVEQIRQIISSNTAIRQWHQLRTRVIGREVFLDVHILVSPDLNIAAAHEIAENLEKTLHEQMTRPVNIIVHVEPDLPELRKNT